MQRHSFRLAGVAAIAAAGLVLAGCSSSEETATETTSTEATASESASESAAIDECALENLTTITPGVLTVGTDTPAYPPYFSDDDPTNGEGFESAVAYAVADKLGFMPADVVWEVVPFNTSYAPGDKNFDFDINQISITPERAEVVDFSDGYYTVNQAVVAFNDSPIAGATTISELKDAKLGAQVGTTSLDFVTEVVQPVAEPYVFNDTNDAKSALSNGQIDGIVVDLPTAYYVTAVEFDDSKIVGQFAAQEGGEEFGLLFQKGNPLVSCVNKALAELKESGELQQIQDTWLAGTTAPYFTE
ncbi:MAG: ABC transporter substrate-binding protein [Candidatus Nanopelagicales bacterium]|nr:ABC transporter substrate-binding protein [Candidatus Nanopelagicales bacterium]MCF8539002.1 ABC transporter substrate-binding protein [Candidatus Nanopelagicales bacterium]MCF8551020.1 ABC transporter substrate-binding protein [Candidatus Nanopelagicales bacterium]